MKEERREAAIQHGLLLGRKSCVIDRHLSRAGFRAYVEFIARQAEVTGWVRNVGYDTVEAVAEGTREKVEQFIERMRRGLNGRVRRWSFGSLG